MAGLDCEVDVVESVDTAVEAEGAVESAEVVVGAEVSVGASVAVDVEEVSEDVVGAEVVGTDELSDGTSDADVEAPKTVPDVSEEGQCRKQVRKHSQTSRVLLWRLHH